MVTVAPVMTGGEFLKRPGDGVERELIDGEVRERPMTARNVAHSRSNSWLPRLLLDWREQQPEPRGDVLCGEARFRIRRNPDTIVGIDVASIGPEHAARTLRQAKFVDGPPLLAIEILSPPDTQEDIAAKIRLYRDAGVHLVGIVETKFETITVYRPDAPPVLFNAAQELTAEPHLPGLRVPVARIFA